MSLVEGVARATGGRGSSANYAVADNGTLFYLSGGGVANSPLVWVDRNGAGDVVDTVPPNAYESPRLSRDDARLLVVADGDAWIYDLESGREGRVTSNGQTMSFAGWTPSGDAVAYTASGPDGTMNIWMAPADGSEEPRQLTALEGLVHFDSFSPDGRTIAAHHHGPGVSDLLRVSVDTPDAEPETMVRQGVPELGHRLLARRALRGAYVEPDGSERDLHPAVSRAGSANAGIGRRGSGAGVGAKRRAFLPASERLRNDGG